VQVVGSDVSLDITRGRAFGPFMQPICGQVADWPHGGRSHATSRCRTSSGRFSNERLSGDDYSGSLANHIAKGENAVLRPLPNFLATSRVRRCRSWPAGQSRRRRDLPSLEVA
jgi:hypothetical protein